MPNVRLPLKLKLWLPNVVLTTLLPIFIPLNSLIQVPAPFILPSNLAITMLLILLPALLALDLIDYKTIHPISSHFRMVNRFSAPFGLGSLSSQNLLPNSFVSSFTYHGVAMVDTPALKNSFISAPCAEEITQPYPTTLNAHVSPMANSMHRSEPFPILDSALPNAPKASSSIFNLSPHPDTDFSNLVHIIQLFRIWQWNLHTSHTSL